MEGGSAVLGYVGDAVITNASYMAPVIVKSSAKAVISTGASTAGVLARVSLTAAIDATKVVLSGKDQSISFGNGPRRALSWLERIASGNGSYQDYGYAITGNDNGQAGSYSLKDRAGNIVGNIDLGKMFAIFKLYAPSVMGDLMSENVEKWFNLIEVYNKVAENTYEYAEELDEARQRKRTEEANAKMKAAMEKLIKYNNLSNSSHVNTGAPKVYKGYKKGTILHTRFGNVKVTSDSTGICCQDDKKASDTVPHLKKKN